jgi:hypothetical protein
LPSTKVAKYYVPQKTTEFWKGNKEKFPNLYKLAKILWNIQALSAFVGRFLVFVALQFLVIVIKEIQK